MLLSIYSHQMILQNSAASMSQFLGLLANVTSDCYQPGNLAGSHMNNEQCSLVLKGKFLEIDMKAKWNIC